MAAKGRTTDGDARSGSVRDKRGTKTGRADRGGDGAAYKAARDQAIIAGAAAGRGTRELSEMHGITQRGVQAVLKAYRGRRTVLEQAPMEIVEDALRRYDAEVEMWALLVERACARPGQEHVALGAMRGYAEVCERRMGALAALGKLPEVLEVFRWEADLSRLGSLVLRALKDVEDGRLSASEAATRVRELVAARDLPTIETSAR